MECLIRCNCRALPSSREVKVVPVPAVVVDPAVVVAVPFEADVERVEVDLELDLERDEELVRGGTRPVGDVGSDMSTSTSPSAFAFAFAFVSSAAIPPVVVGRGEEGGESDRAGVPTADLVPAPASTVAVSLPVPFVPATTAREALAMALISRGSVGYAQADKDPSLDTLSRNLPEWENSSALIWLSVMRWRRFGDHYWHWHVTGDGPAAHRP